MAESVELAVIGAGPAGLTAAVEAAGLGLTVTLVDLFARPGGQYFMQTPYEFNIAPAPSPHAQRLFGSLSQADVTVLPETLVWGIFAEENGYLLGLYGPPGTRRRLSAECVLLAPGAYERPAPFPGWTLPGVMTAGAALTMVKHQQVLPGRRVVLSGTGPLQLILARHLIDAGADLVAVLDANGFPWRGWHHARAIWGQWERLNEGWRSWKAVWRAGAGISWGHTVLRAVGDGQVEQAVIGPVDGSGTETVSADALCLGYGLAPAVQLSHQAGCRHHYQRDLGGYVPVRDEWLQTSLNGLFVAGDGAGIAGKDVALLEGKLAVMAAARQLGRNVATDRVSAVKQDLAQQRRFAAVLNELFPFPSHWLDSLADDTILCRCEEVTVGTIRQVIDEGAATVSAIRMLTRAGMGRCQGRMCGGPVAEFLSSQLGRSVETVGQATTRPPVMPVPLDGLLEDAN